VNIPDIVNNGLSKHIYIHVCNVSVYQGNNVTDSCVLTRLQVARQRLTSPQRYHGNRPNVDSGYVRVGTTSRHRAGKFNRESPTLEDFIVVRHVGDTAVDDCLTTGKLF